MAAHDGILYACPIGPLADQLGAYFGESAAECGPNDAHAYPPHVTVTGFFHDTAPSWPAYARAVETALEQVGPPPVPAAAVTGLFLHEDFHGLAVASPWLLAVGIAFAETAPSSTRLDAVRPKTGLHISLAYGFAPAAGPRLSGLATRLVDPAAEAGWELRLYERAPGNCWLLQGSWPCATPSG